MNNRARELDLLSKVSLDVEDVKIIKSLIKLLEANKDNKDLVLSILPVLLVPLFFAENSDENIDEREKFRSSLKQLDIRNLSYKVVSVVSLHGKAEKILELGRKILKTIDRVFETKLTTFHHSLGSI